MTAELIDEKEKSRTAAHEAGHAAVAAHLGLHFHNLKLGESCLSPDLENEDTSIAAQLELARKELIVAYAGAEAQQLLHPDQWLGDIMVSAVSDNGICESLREEFGFGQADLRQAKKQAASLVRQLLAAIQEIANRLLHEGELPESEVVKIVQTREAKESCP